MRGVWQTTRTVSAARTRSEQTTRPRSARETRAPAITMELSSSLAGGRVEIAGVPDAGSSSHFLAMAASRRALASSPIPRAMPLIPCSCRLALRVCEPEY